MKYRNALLVSVVNLGGIWSSACLAQAAATPPNDTAVQEIVVTANKREQRLNDVGATIGVLSATDLKARQISSLADIAQSVPGLSYSLSSNNTPIFTLRGVGYNESSMSAYPAVTAYLDEAPLPFAALTRHSAFDLDRVEVLKGPQGTLFGSNSTGGAINYVAAKPTATPQAGLDLTYGRFNAFTAEGYVSGPLTDTLRARVSGRVETMGDWQYSTSRPGDTNGRVSNYMGRLLVDFTPTPSIRLHLNVNGWVDKSDTEAAQLVGIDWQLPLHDPTLAKLPFAPANARAADWGANPDTTWGIPNPGFRPMSDDSMFQTSLRGDIDLTPSIVLTSLTSYVYYRENQDNDADGVPVPVADIASHGHVEDIFQELRLSNGSHHRVRWVIGANYEHSTVDQVDNFYYGATSTAITYQAVAGVHLDNALLTSDQTMRNVAGFGNVEVDLLEKLTFKAGARYTDSRISADMCTSDITGDPLGTGGVLYGPGYVPGTCFTYNDLGYAVGNVPAGGKGAYVDTLDENNVSWKAGLDYKLAPHVLLYANASKGFKQGGFATVSATIMSQDLPVSQESVLAFEGGFKATLLDGLLQANGAGFYYDYTNKQLRTKIDPPLFGIQDAIRNVPKSSITGFEVELTARPAHGWSLGTAFTYLDAKIDNYTNFLYANASGNPIITNFSGTRLPFTPKFQFGLNTNYEAPVSQRLVGFVGGDLSYRSSAVTIIGGDQDPPALISPTSHVFNIPGYALVNAHIGIRSNDGRWSISIFGKNVFNKYYWSNVVSANDIIARFAGMPATYGLKLSLKM
jgi:iron complex outermembrane recepter protein